MTQPLLKHAMKVNGLVSSDDSIKIGEPVGAKILVTSKAFAVDSQVFLAAKLVGTETSLVQGALVGGEKNADLAQIMLSAVT